MKTELLNNKYRKKAIEYSYKLEELVNRFLESLFRKDSFPKGKQNTLTCKRLPTNKNRRLYKKVFERNLIELKSEPKRNRTKRKPSRTRPKVARSWLGKDSHSDQPEEIDDPTLPRDPNRQASTGWGGHDSPDPRAVRENE
jgi:hypothetical protein